MSEQADPFKRTKPVVEGLGWGGILPFLLLPLVPAIGLGQAMETLLVAYGLLILAFLCGTMWMEQLLGPEISNGRIIASNLILLAAWPAIVLPLSGAALLLGAGFLAHLGLDQPWNKSLLPGWYGSLRFRLSATVIAILAVTFAVLITDVF